MNQIRNHRLRKGMTQKELAEKAGMSEVYLRAFENGRANNISARLLIQWRKAVGISAEEAEGCV